MIERLEKQDAIEFVSEIEECSVDAFITDPPYCSGAFQEAKQKSAKSQGVRSEGNTSRWFASDNMGTAGLIWLLRSIACEAHRALKNGGHFVMFCDWRQIPNLIPPIESSGLAWRSLVVWDKGTPGLGRGFRAQHEMIAHFCKGTATFHSDHFGNVIKCRRINSRKSEHPTEKPVDLISSLVEVTTKPGDLVVDPFMGAGSTGAAAISLGRRFSGCEREPAFFDAATRRLDGMSARASGQTGLFGVDA